MGPALPDFLVASGQSDLRAEWPRFQQVLEFYNPEKATQMVSIPILSFLLGISTKELIETHIKDVFEYIRFLVSPLRWTLLNY